MDILEVHGITDFQDNDLLHFLIKITIPYLACKKIIDYPAQQKQVVLDPEVGGKVSECGTHTFAINECRET